MGGCHITSVVVGSITAWRMQVTRSTSQLVSAVAKVQLAPLKRLVSGASILFSCHTAFSCVFVTQHPQHPASAASLTHAVLQAHKEGQSFQLHASHPLHAPLKGSCVCVTHCTPNYDRPLKRQGKSAAGCRCILETSQP